ncbi:hypothetical protein OCV88_01710 [Brotonthovivens ammoniilytica]|uniref:Uncharacterized protein n=1 Tax=Brotonthovivens ammoniilytica TaxID=2981725 RepID=A0ABT2TFT6_9FIRM|nr:hypothetical protein [Brotonthovivens ammoniilytica]MCU6761050.1 hypothetical protein [Brotonthovivens ammoniilytica]
MKIPGIQISVHQYVRIDGQWIFVPEYSQSVYSDENGKYAVDNLPLYLKYTNEDGSVLRCMTGYQLKVENIPENVEVTSYMANHGIKDSKLLQENFQLLNTSSELDQCLVLSRTADATTNKAYVSEGFDFVKPILEDQMNAGFLDVLRRILAPKTGDESRWSFLLLMSGVSCLFIFVVLYSRKRQKC